MDLAPRLVSRLQLVVEELFLNTLEHGHRQSSDSLTPVNIEVMVDLEVLEDKVSLTYTDHAPAFNPLINPPGQSTAEATGVGLLLIRRLPDYTHYKRITDTSGNQVKMLFNLAPKLAI